MKEYSFTINGNDYNVGIESMKDGKAIVKVNGEDFEVSLGDGCGAPVPSASCASVPEPTGPLPQKKDPEGKGNEKKITSPLPGVIVEISVKEGDPVRAGQKVAVLEAMKMENEIQAEFSGTVSAIHVSVSDSVLEGDAIISIQG